MDTIIQGIEKGGAVGLAIVFAGLWFLEMRERWRREEESTKFRFQMVRQQMNLVRILTKLHAALAQDDSELDRIGGEDEDR